MKTTKRILSVLLCLCLLLGTVMVFASCDQTEEPPKETADPNANKIQVVRAIKTVEPGSKIVRDQLEEVMVDKDLVPEGTVTSISDIVNKFYKVTVHSGDYIFNDKVSSSADFDKSTEPIHEDYVVLTDYIVVGESDIAKCIQKAVVENPNKTIYIPDGSYSVSRPIKTSADPAKAVSFRLSNYAYISTSQAKWEGGDAIFELGALDSDKGANYSFVGGVIGGGGVTGAFCVKGGSALINNFSLKNVTPGITIKEGARADVDSGVIIGAGSANGGSIGVLIEGNSSTLTNMRIDWVWVGVKITGENNVLRNIHPLYEGTESNTSCGFWDEGTANVFDVCYSDQFAIGFRIGANTSSVFNGCFVYWYKKWDGKHHGFHADGQFNSVIRDTQVNLGGGTQSGNVDSTFINITEPGGSGVIIYPRLPNPGAEQHKENYQAHVKTDILN